MSTPLFEGIDELYTNVANTQPHSVGCVINTAIERIKSATPKQLATELREPSSQMLLLRATVRDEALARILTVCSL